MDSNCHEIIKVFISSVKEYNTQRTEAVTQKLQRCLQILSATSDNNVFDPNNAEGAEFYVSLHDLMSTLDSRTGLMWCAVSVLEEACKNPSAQHALTHRYKFTPILTQLLSGHLILDKQLKVLRLLQDFTYGVKILWQDAHLPLLIQILIRWIKDNDKGCELMSLSLGVLVNLCYKNLPAVYVLRRVIDTKEFVKSILGHGKSVLDIRVQAYKMLIILEEVTGEVSDNEILSCVTWTFKRMYEAFESKNVNVMRHLVDFFKDIKANSNFKNILLKYPSYSKDTEKLITLLDNNVDDLLNNNPNCVTLLLDFVQCIILLHSSDIETIYEPFVKLNLKLIGANPQVSHMALVAICTVTSQTRQNGKQVHLSIINLLDSALPVLLSNLNLNGSEEISVTNSATALFSLLLELNKDAAVSKQILLSLQPMVMKHYFLKVLSHSSQQNDNVFDESSTLFYIQALSLIASLSNVGNEWNELFSELLQEKKLKMRLAASLFTGSSQAKLQVLQLIACLGSDSRLLLDLSECMTELNRFVAPVVDIVKSNGLCLQENHSSASAGQYSAPFLSIAQQTRLDQCISTVQQALNNNNQFGSVGTAAVLELYEYRVAAMSHTENVLQSNLQAVDNYCTQLRHRLSIMTAEINKLLSLLQNKEQNFEEMQSTLNRLQHDINKSEKSRLATENRLNELLRDIEAHKVRYEEAVLEIANSKQHVSDLMNQIQELNAIHDKDLEQQQELKNDIENYKRELGNKEQIIQQKINDCKKKQKELEDTVTVVQNREKKIERQESLIKGFEKAICDKDNEIAQQQSEIAELEAQIAELEAMRDLIMKVTMDKERKNSNRK